ncbi:DNA recombination protein RmuC [Enemella evansiae]|uniref:DNA recombination protein RmuC n=1 Tax=Enemella evansiae TaxID=2016499 RepID=UPI000B96E07F|nr:DNA recombination protein RmuC [Enemella evansiae]OYO03855.1 DNA recombination protein RmuC [Enemella evansiae]
MEITAVLMLVIGLALGAAGAWFALRARASAAAAEDRSIAATSRAEAADARAQAADARTETATLRAQLHRLEANAAETRGQVAEARAETAQAQSEAAEVSSQLAAARAERDAARERAQRLAEDREALANQFKVLSGETLERQGKATDEKTRAIIDPLTELMTKFAERLNAVEKDRVAMATDLRNQVTAVQATGEHLRRETHALATALRKPQVRGAWGELQLRRVAEYAGMVERCDFDEQASTTTSADRAIRPDMRVNLSDGKFLYVDAKVPLSAFLEAHETEDERLRAEKLTLFGRNVKTHVDQLSRKEYWKADTGTPEFVVMFLPNEQFLFSALEQLPDLHEYAAARDVVVATPNTLIAMLRAVAYGWKQAALAESAAEVFTLGRELHDRLAAMGGHLDKVGRSLKAAVGAYNSTVGSLEARVLVTARRFRDLKVTDAELTAPQSVDESTRDIAAPELVEDAARVEPMIGRGAKRRKALPERDELSREQPDLLGWADPPTERRRGTGTD